ncbi:aldehyde dehydrogenase family protein [Pararhodobacter oceanensis]|uniref:aldehyde dehydrogenase family protein n=1 Tax=Pararhodobacter oceanensis TaxID=2172121 RepID=UPI003A8DDD82
MNTGQFYIDGAWRAPLSSETMAIENPATGATLGQLALGNLADTDRAIAAARAAFDGWTQTPVAERIEALRRLLDAYNARFEEMAQAISAEMGAPITWARDAQAWAGRAHLEATIQAAEAMTWEEMRGSTRIIREGIGVCGLITPWNWPMNQIVCKVAPALAAGCTMVLKPSEIAPLSGLLFAEICDAAELPKGVFNLVNGSGPVVGARLSEHPQVDMISFTGSTRAGTAVAAAAAPSVKRVAQELGGKSPNIILDHDGFDAAVKAGAQAVFDNTGQSCDAPTRMLVPRALHDRAATLAAEVAAAVITGDPRDAATTMGPLVSGVHWAKVQGLITAGIEEGAACVAGGLGRPEGQKSGWFVRPTVFANVDNTMRIAQEEIFGPVLSIIPFDDTADAIRIANDTPYGLAAYVSGPQDQAQEIARHLRAGMVNINSPDWDLFAPFGGYKQSGNGREYADWAIHDFCEVKGIAGWG